MVLAVSLRANRAARTNLGYRHDRQWIPWELAGRNTAKRRFCRPGMVVLALMALLVGCTTVEKQKAFNTENFLVEAGFKYRVADTPQRLEQLNKFPQRKLVHRERDGRKVYLYADALECKCLWSGDETAYQNLQQRLRSAKLTARQEKGLWTEELARLGPSEPAGTYLDETDPAMVPFF
jgi:hypothetical protein